MWAGVLIAGSMYFYSRSSEKPDCDFHNDYINLHSRRNMKISSTLLAILID